MSAVWARFRAATRAPDPTRPAAPRRLEAALAAEAAVGASAHSWSWAGNGAGAGAGGYGRAPPQEQEGGHPLEGMVLGEAATAAGGDQGNKGAGPEPPLPGPGVAGDCPAVDEREWLARAILQARSTASRCGPTPYPTSSSRTSPNKATQQAAAG